jgi:hypothetical protein
MKYVEMVIEINFSAMMETRSEAMDVIKLVNCNLVLIATLINNLLFVNQTLDLLIN